MTPRGVIFATTTVLLVLLAGCEDPRTSITDAGVLRIDDFPPGFRSVAIPEPGGGSGDEPDECAAIAQAEQAGLDTTESSDGFIGEAAFAGNEIDVYREAFVAENVLDVWSTAEDAKPCLELLMAAMVELGATDPFFSAAFSAFEIDVAPIPVPELGDERAAWRGELNLEGREQAETFYFDIAVVRVERVVNTLVVLGIGEPADSLRQSLFEATTGRLVDTNA